MAYVSSSNIVFPAFDKTAMGDPEMFNHPVAPDVLEDPTFNLVRINKLNNVMYSDILFRLDYPIEYSHILIHEGLQKSFKLMEVDGVQTLSFVDKNVLSGTVTVVDTGAKLVKHVYSATADIKTLSFEVYFSDYLGCNTDPDSFFAFADNKLIKGSWVLSGSKYTFSFNYVGELHVYGALPKETSFLFEVNSRTLRNCEGYIIHDVLKFDTVTGQTCKIANPDLRYYPWYEMESTGGTTASYFFRKTVFKSKSIPVLQTLDFNPTTMAELKANSYVVGRMSSNFNSLCNVKMNMLTRISNVDYNNLASLIKKSKDSLLTGRKWISNGKLPTVARSTSVLKVVYVLFKGSVMNKKLLEYDPEIVTYYEDIKKGIYFSIKSDNLITITGYFDKATNQFIQSDDGSETKTFIFITTIYPYDLEKLISIRNRGEITADLSCGIETVRILSQMENGDIGFSSIITTQYETPKSPTDTTAVSMIKVSDYCRSVIFNSEKYFNVDDGFSMVAGMSFYSSGNNSWLCIVDGKVVLGAQRSNVVDIKSMDKIIYNNANLDEDIIVMINSNYSGIMTYSAPDMNLGSRGIIRIDRFNPEVDILIINGSLVPYENIKFILGGVWFTIDGYNASDPTKYNGYAIQSISVLKYQDQVISTIGYGLYSCDLAYYTEYLKTHREEINALYPVVTPTKTWVPAEYPMKAPNSIKGIADYMATTFVNRSPVDVLMDMDNDTQVQNFKNRIKEVFSSMTLHNALGIVGNDKILINGNSGENKYLKYETEE